MSIEACCVNVIVHTKPIYLKMLLRAYNFSYEQNNKKLKHCKVLVSKNV